MKISENNTIGEIVAGNYKSATVFRNHGIDFCCKGGRTLKDVCETKNISSETLLDELNTTLQETEKPAIDFQSFPPDLLADYIEKKHHRYVTNAIPVLLQYLDKVSKVHGDKQPELYEVTSLFRESAAALTQHMKKEELILFPYIRKLVERGSEGQAHNSNLFTTIDEPVAMMMNEHTIEGDRFRELARLTGNYNPPEWACNTFKVSYALLKEFEEDLHLHIHLENNLLFPKALALNKSYKALN
jgi:regulator of cell morphogenesis and NO signaling